MKEKFGRDYFYGRKESNYYNYNRMDSSKMFKSITSFIKDNGIGGSFLDVGCAFGLLLGEVYPLFDELYGCDISKFAIEKARQKNPKAHLKIVDIQKKLPYDDESFDFITALDVLEHTADFEKIFKNIAEKLKMGGYLIVSTPIRAWPRRVFDYLDKDKTHISILREDEIIQIINDSGLSVINKKRFAAVPFFYRIPYIPAEIELYLRRVPKIKQINK